MAGTQDAPSVTMERAATVPRAAAAWQEDEPPPRLPDRLRRARERLADGAAKPKPQSSTAGWTNWYSYWS
jgi:hypothetical protein